MELSAVRAVRASSNAALEKTLYTHAGGLASVPSTNSTEIAASTVDYSAALLWAWNRIVRCLYNVYILQTFVDMLLRTHINMIWCLLFCLQLCSVRGSLLKWTPERSPSTVRPPLRKSTSARTCVALWLPLPLLYPIRKLPGTATSQCPSKCLTICFQNYFYN